MPKRKRAVAMVKARRALSTRTKNFKISEEPEHEEDGDFELEIEPTEEEEDEEFDPELEGKWKKENTVIKKCSGDKISQEKPTVSRKDKIKIEDKNGEPIIRAPQVNSDYLPLPWKGRLGFACLNTYLRTSNPPVFCSRTCRISTIQQKGSAADGQAYVESLGIANAWDLSKMIRWNEKYGIKFLRISSEMFPFASHDKYGYTLDFAMEPLREAGRLAMEFGHRLTTHPGQYTQLASLRGEVITASIRDLEYHSQMLRLLGLEGQADRDAVMILHMGGVFGDKKATLDRFRKSYNTLLSNDVKARLVLENDDVNWTVHDLLPICQELNIPLVLDYHHHNIRHREDLREGTLDLIPFLGEIKETWTRKHITQKQHYSEARDNAVTDRDMRKHSKRVRGLPPCDPAMDLMIEAKDKEQAVFELYRKYGIGGEGLFNEIMPHTRTDENRLEQPMRKTKGIKEGKDVPVSVAIAEEDLGMGGEERRVYWPEGKEDWLSPPKKVRKKKEEVTEMVTEEITVNGDPAEMTNKSISRRRKVKKVKEAEEVTVMVMDSEHTKSRRRTKKSTVKTGEFSLALDPKAKPRVPRTRGQKIAAKAKPEDEDEEYVSASILPVEVALKWARAPPAREVTKKVAAPSLDSDSDLSSPVVSDNE